VHQRAVRHLNAEVGVTLAELLQRVVPVSASPQARAAGAASRPR
jgi:hypothetical protein